MIIITDITFVEVKGEEFFFKHTYTTNNHGEPVDIVDVYEEYLQGLQFTRPDGKKIVVGFTKQAEEILGLSYAVYDHLSKELTKAQDRYQLAVESLEICNKELMELKNMTLWQRIKRT